MIKGKRVYLTLLITVEMLFVLVLGVYAWVEGVATPNITSSNMQLSSSPGLIMKLNGAITNTIDLNRYVQDNGSTLILSEASSADGKTIYLRDNTSDAEGDEIKLRDESIGDANVNYLSVHFTLTADNSRMKIWMKYDDSTETSCIADKLTGDKDKAQAIRMSLAIRKLDDNGNQVSGEDIRIFSDLYESEPQTFRGVADYDRSNSNLIDDDAQIYMKPVLVYPLSYFNENNPWLELDKNQTAQITMKVWLEGTDANCIDEIAGSSILFRIYFASMAIEDSLN